MKTSQQEALMMRKQRTSPSRKHDALTARLKSNPYARVHTIKPTLVGLGLITCAYGKAGIAKVHKRKAPKLSKPSVYWA